MIKPNHRISHEVLISHLVGSESRYDIMVGNSHHMRSIARLVDTLQDSSAALLITGEKGTGKELLARTLHRRSRRAAEHFSVLNCSALNELSLENDIFGCEEGVIPGVDFRKIGKIEAADRGTLFVDEIGDIPLGFQPEFLRVLQELMFCRVGGDRFYKVDMHVIAATSKDLKQAIKIGTFREELYWRLNVVHVRLPPLRERIEDIIPLSKFFLARYSGGLNKSTPRLSTDASKVLRQHSWPGNVGELEKLMAVVVARGVSKQGMITSEFIQEALSPSRPSNLS